MQSRGGRGYKRTKTYYRSPSFVNDPSAVKPAQLSHGVTPEQKEIEVSEPENPHAALIQQQVVPSTTLKSTWGNTVPISLLSDEMPRFPDHGFGKAAVAIQQELSPGLEIGGTQNCDKEQDTQPASQPTPPVANDANPVTQRLLKLQPESSGSQPLDIEMDISQVQPIPGPSEQEQVPQVENNLLLEKYIGKFVQIEAKSNLSYKGRLFSVDPIFKSVIIGIRPKHQGPVNVQIVSGSAILSVKVIENDPASRLLSLQELQATFNRMASNKNIPPMGAPQNQALQHMSNSVPAQKRRMRSRRGRR